MPLLLRRPYMGLPGRMIAKNIVYNLYMAADAEAQSTYSSRKLTFVNSPISSSLPMHAEG